MVLKITASSRLFTARRIFSSSFSSSVSGLSQSGLVSFMYWSGSFVSDGDIFTGCGMFSAWFLSYKLVSDLSYSVLVICMPVSSVGEVFTGFDTFSSSFSSSETGLSQLVLIFFMTESSVSDGEEARLHFPNIFVTTITCESFQNLRTEWWIKNDELVIVTS